ncbi:TasA family protein [Thermococcus gorgonarius]|uniref:Uncharacterized protein n=1 Tax=Thermococcus gorgonarius TaxID=71997 RepID=A0A2Z2M7U5_THEGO|nr:TasA family protein [Thermococcus gorgonarius]ASJ01389.1 hypothetical protein A3K92_07795 [Thermococcus gorgonarius]
MKSIAVALLLIGLVFAGAGYGTWAIYQDTETSEGNSIELGTLDLVLTDGVPVANGQWFIPNAVPGSLYNGDIKIINNGTVDADHVEIAIELVCWEDDDGNIDNGRAWGPEPDEVNGVGDLPQEIKVNMQYREEWIGPSATLQLENGAALGDVVYNVYNLPAPPRVNGDVNDALWNKKYGQFDMYLWIEDTGQPQNYWQGDVCEIIVHVALAQDSSQQILSPYGFTEYPVPVLPE